jgi:hypothetical protein
MNILDLPRTDIQMIDMHCLMKAVLVPTNLTAAHAAAEVEALKPIQLITGFMAAMPIADAFKRLTQLTHYLEEKTLAPSHFDRVLGVLFSMGVPARPKTVVFSS